jgi:GH18 family chitinase
MPHRLFFAAALFVAGSLPAASVTLTLDPAAQVGTIDPRAYGANHLDVQHATLRRVGGNRMTGYNWENNASNAGTDYINNSDYYLLGQVGLPQNGSQVPAAVPKQYVNLFRAAGSLAELVTVQAAGYVSADASGTVSAAETAPSARWKAVLPHKPGAPASFSLVPDQTDGVVYIDEQVNALVNQFGPASAGGIQAYAIDNEPGLWSSTHPRIHPTPATYSEVLARTSSTAEAILAVDPSARIHGPASYGWGEYQDMQGASDAGTYNPTYGWFLSYYLDQMRLSSLSSGKRLLHALDLHWYPEAQDSSNTRICCLSTPDLTTTAAVQARVQAPRSLWDPTYTENSWIAQWQTSGPIDLIHRVRNSIASYYPGTDLAISEYDYGAPDHISGGIAQADVLGIMGKYGVIACRWGSVSGSSYVQSAFDLFRDYDGAGATFGDLSFSASSSDIATVTVYAAKQSTDPGLFTVVALNKDDASATTTTVNLSLSGQSIQSLAWRRFDSTGSTITSISPPSFTASSFTAVLPALSANLFIIRVAAPGSPTYTRTATLTRSPTPQLSPTPSVTLTPTRTLSFTTTPTRSPSFTASPSPTQTVTPLPPYTCPRHVTEFYPYWVGASPSSIPWTKISHLAHAFIRPLADGSLDVPSGYLDPSLNSLAHSNGVKMIVSVGGAGNSSGDGSEFWSTVVNSPTARATLVQNLYNFCLANSYDGVDIDFEFPSNSSDKAALTAFVQALRAKFSSSSAPAPGWQISGDLSWDSYYGQWWDVATLKLSMDYFNLMVYDMYGTWTSVAGHNAALFDSTLPGAPANHSGIYSINYYTGRGVPAQQLQYGLAAYGYQFSVSNIYASCTSTGCANTSLAYSAIAPLTTPGSGWTRYYDSSAQSPYLLQNSGGAMISYDDPQSIDAKTREVLWNQGVGGVFIWELDNDNIGGTHPLLDAASNASLCATATPTPTRSASPTFSVSPTITQTPTISPTFTQSDTFTVSPTFSVSPSISPTFSISPTPTVTATPTPMPTGPLEILAAEPMPQPGPRLLKVQLAGPVDELELVLYSASYAKVAELSVQGLPLGWSGVPVQILNNGLANGLYFLRLRARQGSEWTKKPKLLRYVILR